MPTSKRQLATQAVTANTTAGAVSLASVTTQTYIMHVYVQGGTDVWVVENGGTDGETGLRVATLTAETFGPWRTSDGAPKLYSTGSSACEVTIEEVTGEA